jgi:hypothetical protein
MRIAGAVLVIVGAVVVVGGTFLPFFSDSSTWDFDPHSGGLLTLAAIGALILASIALASNSWAVRVLPAPLAFLILGRVAEPDVSGWLDLGAGFWLMNIGALAMAAGGVMLLVGLKVPSEQSRPRYGAAAHQAARPSPLAQASPAYAHAGAVQAAGPPAGWYADPSRQAAERYWSGAAWTGHLR